MWFKCREKESQAVGLVLFSHAIYVWIYVILVYL